MPKRCPIAQMFPTKTALTRENTATRVEPPVRIELTTVRLQGECSTTELRRPVLTGDSLTAQSSWSELSWSMIR